MPEVAKSPADQFTPRGREYLASDAQICFLALADSLGECVVFDVTGPAPEIVFGDGWSYASARTIAALSDQNGLVLLGKFKSSRECVEAAYAFWNAD